MTPKIFHASFTLKLFLALASFTQASPVLADCTMVNAITNAYQDQGRELRRLIGMGVDINHAFPRDCLNVLGHDYSYYETPITFSTKLLAYSPGDFRASGHISTRILISAGVDLSKDGHPVVSNLFFAYGGADEELWALVLNAPSINLGDFRLYDVSEWNRNTLEAASEEKFRLVAKKLKWLDIDLRIACALKSPAAASALTRELNDRGIPPSDETLEFCAGGKSGEAVIRNSTYIDPNRIRKWTGHFQGRFAINYTIQGSMLQFITSADFIFNSNFILEALNKGADITRGNPATQSPVVSLAKFFAYCGNTVDGNACGNYSWSENLETNKKIIDAVALQLSGKLASDETYHSQSLSYIHLGQVGSYLLQFSRSSNHLFKQFEHVMEVQNYFIEKMVAAGMNVNAKPSLCTNGYTCYFRDPKYSALKLARVLDNDCRVFIKDRRTRAICRKLVNHRIEILQRAGAREF